MTPLNLLCLEEAVSCHLDCTKSLRGGAAEGMAYSRNFRPTCLTYCVNACFFLRFSQETDLRARAGMRSNFSLISRVFMSKGICLFWFRVFRVEGPGSRVQGLGSLRHDALNVRWYRKP